ncbi:MAG: DNA-binding protein [Gemmataceae bacterium]|nr:DNA-binding protein [Gemmataceae bacterium]
MAQGYYTLTEAAQYLKISVDELKQMAHKGKIRSFQDRGTLRFRVQDIQDLARTRGTGSDSEQALNDAGLPAPKSSATPPSGLKNGPASPKSPVKKARAPDVFAFEGDADSVNLGADVMSPSSSKSKPLGSTSKKVPAPSPATAGSDSDVRLVPDGSGAKVSPDRLKLKPAMHTPPPSPALPKPADSGVRLVPMDNGSDVKLVGSDHNVPLGESGTPTSSDSDVRLDKVELPPADAHDGDMMLTKEYNLDDEILNQQEHVKNKPPTKLKAKSEMKLPTTSPFELSESDLGLPSELKLGGGPKTPVKSAPGTDSSGREIAAGPQQGSSDLVPSEDSSFLLEGGTNDLSLEASDDQEDVLQEEHTEVTPSSSGISLENPADAGIPPDDGGDDFDLSLEVEDTPKPVKSQPAEDSEFELNLSGSSEGAAGAIDDSESEFELTLDDSGNLEPVMDSAPQVKSKNKAPASSGEQDIFGTDFEVPALEDSEDSTVADSELESSDFDLELDDSELPQEEESASQVVALDEEDAATVADDDAAVVDDVEVEEESSDFSALDEDVQGDEDDEETAPRGRTETVIKEKLIPAAPWGVMPVIFMLPCVVIMFLVGILGYELVQTSTGLKPPGPLTLAIADILNQPVTLGAKK